MNYTLDTAQARKADQRGMVITETGKYIGRFPRVEDIKAASGTKGVDFSFVSREGKKARFALYTEKANGDRIGIGHAFMMALMTCMKLREIRPTEAKVVKWDPNAGAEIEVVAMCYPDMMDKEIGVLLEAEEYEKRDGSVSIRMVLAGCFQAQSELMAGEILDQKIKPEQLTKVVATLRDRPLKRPSGKAAPATTKPAGGIPF
jgi:hypothetical protein